MKFTRVFACMALAGLAGNAYATNGMNLEGYGPIAAGMGGASMAYDNGTAAVMNNPATLGLMADGNRLDVAVGMLGPDVSVSFGGGPEASSGGDSYLMPAIGWIQKSGPMSYGVAMFAQGGMGTEWDDATFRTNYSVDGGVQRSELGVGRLIAPLAYEVTPDLVLGGSVDFVWAMLDLRMAMPLASMAGLVTDPGNGMIMGALGTMMGAGYDNARLDFSDSDDFTGKAKGYGLAGKLGFTYKINPMVSIGGTYHSKTNLNDMETSTSGAFMIVSDNEGFPTETVPGKITVRDFQWPATYGLGVAVQATPELLVAVDYKRIGWEDVMKNFTMTYTAMGDSVTFALPQNWDDQNVISLGVAYKATDALTLRAGANISDNPIPDATMNFLFPAIVEEHYTIGAGYAFNPASEVNFSLQHAPEVEQTNPNMMATVKHSQTSWQLMYSHKF
jgi:long-chain fatty acid transport protein